MTQATSEKRGNGSQRHTRTTSHGGPEFSEGPQTVQEMITLGESAARALNSEAVSLGLQFAVRDLQNQWAESLPEEKNKREGLYWTARGLNSFVVTLNGFVQRAQSVIHEQNEKQRMDDQAYQAGIPPQEM